MLTLTRHSWLAQTSDKQVDEPVETRVQVYRHSEAARYFQRDKALHDTAQAANGMNSLFLAKFVRREHGQHNFHHLLRDDLYLLVARRWRLQRERITPRCFSAIGPVGIGERDNSLCARFPDGCAADAIK